MPINRWLAELACTLRRRESRWYWLVHELHMLFFWRKRERARWELHNRERT